MDVKNINPRAIEEAELPKVIDFLNRSLRPNQSWSIENEYPQVFQKQACPYIQIIEHEGNILSHAAWRPLVIKTELGLFKVAVIGSVVTDEKYRKQGLSRKIIENVISEAKACGCELAILWSDKVDFYEKFGFALVGHENTALINQELSTDPTQLKILDTKQISPEALYKLYQRHTVSSIRSIEDVKRFLSIPNTRIYSAWEENQIKAYIVEGKGADFDSYIHEWAGDIPALKQLVNHAYKTQGRELRWMIPGHSVNLIETLRKEQVFVHSGVLGLVKILNIPSLNSKISRFARGHLRFSDFNLLEQDGKAYVGFGESMYEFSNLIDFTRLIFGPSYPSELKVFEPSMAKKLDLIFPLKMWIWGWDSI